MGGFTPAGLVGLLQIGLSAAQRSDRARAAEAAQAEQANLRIQQIEQARQADAQDRARALRQAAAAQRARFAAGGVGLDGSAGSVLSGLAIEAAEQDRQAADRARLQVDRISTGLDASRRRNLLDVTQPLVQSGFDAIRRNLSRTSLLR